MNIELYICRILPVNLTLPTTLVLQALACGHHYGFDVMDATGLPSGTVYPLLRRLEHEGLAAGRPGLGTFVTRSLAQESVAAHKGLRLELGRWLDKARQAGLDDASISALFESTFRAASDEGVA